MNGKINKSFILNHIAAIICVLEFAFIFLPFVEFEMNVNIGGFGGSHSSAYSAFQIMTDYFTWGILMVLLPIITIAASVYKPLLPHKKLINIVAPGLHTLVIIFLSTRASMADSGMSSSAIDLDINRKIGFWLLLLCSAGLTAYGVWCFMKAPIVSDIGAAENENNNTEPLNAEKIGNMAKSAAETIRNLDAAKAGEIAKNAAGNVSERYKSATTKSTHSSNANTNEIIEQLKKLNELKEMGILTEDEFNEKKGELLAKM